ncbi:MAG: hypothetical protein AB1898_19910 [Acidobacteriota bacterium]
MQSKISVGLLAGCFLFIGGTAWATTVERLSLEELVQKSNRIVQGQCLSTESRWTADHRLVLTRSRFAVTEDLKGKSGGFITVITVGGTVDNITQTVSGMPEFRTHEEVVLFLEPAKSGGWQPLGLAQGKYRIVRDSQSGQDEVIQSLGGLTLYDPSRRAISTDSSLRRAPLSAFKEEIKRLLVK